MVEIGKYFEAEPTQLTNRVNMRPGGEIREEKEEAMIDPGSSLPAKLAQPYQQ